MLPSLLHMGFDNHYNCVDEHDYNQRMQILLPFDRVFPPVSYTHLPFIPFRPVCFPQIFSWLSSVQNSTTSHADVDTNTVMNTDLSGTTNWMNDFALSVNHDTSSVTGYILLSIWIVGMLSLIHIFASCRTLDQANCWIIFSTLDL